MWIVHPYDIQFSISQTQFYSQLAAYCGVTCCWSSPSVGVADI